MAEEKDTSSPWAPVGFVLLLVGALFILWWYNGGPERSGGIRGLFIAPPPPLGTGEIYGPEVGTTTNQQ